MSKLYDVLEWAKTHGEVRALDRIRMMVIGSALKERIQLGHVTPDTECSEELLKLVRKAASDVVGTVCPL